MSPPSKKKKRSYDDSLAVIEAEDPSSSSSLVMSSRTTTRTFGVSTPLPPFVLEQQIESLKVELDHERSLRVLDRKRAQHAKERLEKQVDIAVEEAKEASKALEDFREQSERMMEQLRQSRNQAVAELRKQQIQQLESVTPAGSGEEDRLDGEDDDDDENNNQDASSMANVWKEKCHHLEKLLETQRDKEEELQLRFTSLREDVQARATRQQGGVDSDHAGSLPVSVLEDAPPAVMKELNSVRICLAESERRERQLSRKVEDVQRRNQSLIQEREEARLAKQRLPKVLEQLEQIRSEFETLAAQHQSWNEFGASIETIIHNNDTGATTSTGCSTTTPPSTKKKKGPPEVLTIQRFLENAKSRVMDLEKQNSSLYDQNKTLKSATLPLERQIKELSEAEQATQKEKRNVEHKLDLSQRQVSQLEAQQNIHRREIENLQSLIKTFDNLPLPASSSSKPSGSGSSSAGVTKMDRSQRTLELSLTSAKEELQMVQSERDRLLEESENTRNELERVKEKFGKLRDALLAERAKVEQAELRANEAETLAGKGSFNPETTRVLHLQDTPLTQSLKEEIKVLQRRLEVANSHASSSKQQVAADPAKLNKRLKVRFSRLAHLDYFFVSLSMSVFLFNIWPVNTVATLQ